MLFRSGSETSLSGSLWTLMGGYTMTQGDWGHVDITGGFRLFSLNAETNIRLAADVTAPGGSASFSRNARVSDNASLLDGVVGLRGRFVLGNGFFLQQQIRPRLYFKTEAQVFFFDKICELPHPSGFQAEDIVRHPDVRGAIQLKENPQVPDGSFRAMNVVTVSVNWFCAPVTVKGASPCRAEVQGKESGGSHPPFAVFLHVDQVPAGRRKFIGVS